LQILENEIERYSKEMNEKRRNLEDFKKIHNAKLIELQLTEERIETINLKIIDYVSILENLNLERKKAKDFIENIQLIDLIVVDEERNACLPNGLVSVNRDILMKLIKLIRDEKKTRTVVLI
jgi:hypothetical protein